MIFYGDHLPGIYSTAASDPKNGVNLHETDYFIWSNQASESNGTKLDAKESSYTSSSFFMPLAAEHMNAKVSPYLEFLDTVYEEIPAMTRPVSSTSDQTGDNNKTYLAEDGTTVSYDPMSAKAKKLLEEYKLVQYDLTAGKGYLNDTKFFDVK